MAKANQYGSAIEQRDEHYTPKWIFDAMEIVFDLDVASPIGGSHVPCRRYFTEKDDGYAQDWTGNVWMNPPFSELTKWMDKFNNHKNGIALVPASRSRWADETWNSNAGIVLVEPRMKFERPEGLKPKATAFQIWLVAHGESNKQAIAKVGKLR